MTINTECSRLRISLGVYVLGAIEPAERAMVDEHLATCARCRDELASLAGLPALLGRVTEEQIARLSPPTGELFDSTLAKAARESRGRRRKNIVWLAAAAVALVVASGAGVGVIAQSDHPGGVPSATSTPQAEKGVTVSGNDPTTGVQADITMNEEEWGTALRVRLKGAKPGTRCQLFAVDKNGARDVAGGWLVPAGEYDEGFWGSSMIPRDQIAWLEVRTIDGKRLLTVRS
jgi:hypothetical protein